MTKSRTAGPTLPAPMRTAVAAWRALLAHDIAGHAPGIASNDLTLASDQAIERCLFLRLCENAGILAPGALADLSRGEGIAARLSDTFRRVAGNAATFDEPTE